MIPEKTNVTMKDIARLAGVTTQTVSRALCGSDKVNPITKKKILELAAQLKYVKNSSAATLRSGSSKTVAVFYDNLRNIFFPLISDFLQYNLRERGYTMLTFSLYGEELSEQILRLVTAKNVDGVISFVEPSKELADFLESSLTPFVMYGRTSDNGDFDCVVTDDERGGELAAERLIGGGCKKLLFITESTDLSCAHERLMGFRKVVESRGAELTVYENTPECTFEEGLKRLTDCGYRPDGIFCFNDMLALMAMKIFSFGNADSPKIIGFDDICAEVTLPVRLTSIGTDKAAAAKTAVDMLLDRINSPSTPTVKKVMPVFVAEGESG